VGYFMGSDPVTRIDHLYGLTAGGLQVGPIAEVSFAEPLADQAPVTGVVGPLADPGAGNAGPLATERTLFVYQEASGLVVGGDEQYEPAPSSPARLYLASVEGLSSGDTVLLETGQSRFGVATPQVSRARLATTGGDRLLLLGQTSTRTGQVMAFTLDLATGQWFGPRNLELPPGLQGYTTHYDPVSGDVLLFGGVDARGRASAKIFAVEMGTGVVRELPTPAGRPAAVARADAGAQLDLATRSLYVFGGARDGALLADGWRYHLPSGTWQAVAAPAEQPTPGGVFAPFVHYDAGRGRLWVGDLVSSSTADGLALWVRDRHGDWSDARLTVLRPAQPFPVDDRYIAGRTHVYAFTAPAGADWPGPLSLAATTGESGIHFEGEGEIHSSCMI
jgi:hypothetical protein